MEPKDELIRMLNDRGASVKEDGYWICWDDPRSKGHDIRAHVRQNGTAGVHMHNLTLAEVVEVTLDRGECEMLALERYDGMQPGYRCTACGLENYEPKSPSYCPHCGSRVRERIDHGRS